MARPTLLLLLALGILGILGSAACGDDDPGCVSDDACGLDICVDGRCVPGSDSGPIVDSGVDTSTLDISVELDSGPACTEDCGDGDCIDGLCCASNLSCDGVCCATDDVCSFNVCTTPGITCNGVEDCGEDEYCEPRLGETVDMCGASATTRGRCLPAPPTCPDGTSPDPASPECIATCRFEPPAGDPNVQLAYAWGMFDGDRAAPNVFDIRNSPIVINLDDDDCDGRITARDIPEIVVITSPDDSTHPTANGPLGDLVVLAVSDGELREKWRVPEVAAPWTYPAAGDFHSNPGNEIVICAQNRQKMMAYGVGEDGLVLLWERRLEARGRSCAMPSLFDIDQDGDVEILTLDGLLDGETGEIEYALPGASAIAGYGIAADVDGDADHDLEIVFANRIFNLEGGALVEMAVGPANTDHAIVVQLDGEGLPEIVSTDFHTHTMFIWNLEGPDGTARYFRQNLDINGSLDPARCGATSAGFTRGGGPATAADVNADGTPDIAIAGGVGYAVLDGSRLVDPDISDADTFLWTAETVDCSSAQTGSSVFDFNGDGRAEVLYADEHTFRIYRGEDGTELFSTCNTNGTILEQPIVADVDNDGQADIIVVSNARYRNCLDDNTQSTSGVRVFSSRDGDWVRTRRVWNQHAYQITNINEDGSVPARETPNWNTDGLNNFRLNRQPGSENAAPDVTVQLVPVCTEGAIDVTVRNLGESVLPSGVTVVLYRGASPDMANVIGEMETTQTLYPAQAQTLRFAVEPEDRAAMEDASVGAWATATPPDGTPECRAENNSGRLSRFCDLM